MLSDLLKWGARRPDVAAVGTDVHPERGADPVIASKGFPRFLSALSQRDTPVLLDFGPVIGTNVEFFGDRLGCKLFIEDLFADLDRHIRAGTLGSLPAAFETRFRHADASVDGVLCWDVFDYLDKHAAAALAKQVIRMLRPGGSVMGFFCSSAVERAPFTKYEIVEGSGLRHRLHQGGGPKRVLQNRDIIRMFDGLVVSDSFLLKSNTREMLLRRRVDAQATP
ncbi:MAG TPA: class I SAM-dependent methyltransferase [Vicinamibacterales bacterium]|nr:class I SAM-dependent methyltransferase [Vicinamibacterales bacterium]